MGRKSRWTTLAHQFWHLWQALACRDSLKAWHPDRDYRILFRGGCWVIEERLPKAKKAR
jgi:hypothetical protein